MMERTRMILAVLVVVLAGWALPVRAIAQATVEYSGGAVKAVLGKTQTAPAFALFDQTDWVNLPGSALRLTVPGGTSDLFSLSFSGDCFYNDGQIKIRVVAVVDGVGIVVPPSDTGSPSVDGRYICASIGTHAATWVMRGGPGNYRFSVQFRHLTAGHQAGWDDWHFQVVVYD